MFIRNVRFYKSKLQTVMNKAHFLQIQNSHEYQILRTNNMRAVKKKFTQINKIIILLLLSYLVRFNVMAQHTFYSASADWNRGGSQLAALESSNLTSAYNFDLNVKNYGIPKNK